LSIYWVAKLAITAFIHFVNLFQAELKALIASEPSLGNQRALAIKAGIDRGLLSRILKVEDGRTATPQLVGRICGILPANAAKLLLVAYLTDVAAEAAAAYPKSKKTVQAEISIQTQVRVPSARKIA
jgi:hypothetical protein